MAVLAMAFVLCFAVSLAWVEARQAAAAQGAVAVDSNDIGGVVISTKGPEAGVWVIAETTELPTRFIRIVVTDDRGRYLVPDLPKADYKLWVRGYGLVDSSPVRSAPGKIVNLTAVAAPTPRAAAQVYPSSYWYSLMQVPPSSAFPIKGGGTYVIQNQEEWIEQLKNRCEICHQQGSKATREIPEPLGKFSSSREAWTRRVKSGQYGASMSAALERWGPKALDAYADWTDRIAAGEVPPSPPRPQGVERNVVISEWEWSTDRTFVHDAISTDKRNPTVNANGPVYSVDEFGDDKMNIVDPVANRASALDVPYRTGPEEPPISSPMNVLEPSPYWGDQPLWHTRMNLHNPLIDQKGRVWITAKIRGQFQPAFCKEGSNNPSAQRFPLPEPTPNDPRQVSIYDPKTEKFTMVDTCFRTHHEQFAEDADNTLYFSGGGADRGGVVGWINTRVWDETGDASKAQGWCAFIRDSNGNGKVDAWVEPGQPGDPAKDTRITSTTYGVAVNQVDGSVWQTTGSGTPGHILRVDPKTCLTEIYQPPFRNPKSAVSGFTPRGIDADSNGVMWTALAGSGHLASFDRRKCKVLNGPTATGQHCPEGWTLYPTPGPKFKGVTDQYNSDYHYYNWVDQLDTFGLGKNVPIVNGTGSDSLLAMLPGGKFVIIRVPYPLNFHSRNIDGRIDDPKAGWRGKGLWTAYSSVVPWHMEGGKGTHSTAVHFQIRPDPLAH